MYIKPVLTLGKFWLLLLLLSNPAAAARNSLNGSFESGSGAALLYRSGDSFHKEALQPQMPSVRIMYEHNSKPMGFGYVLPDQGQSTRLVVSLVGKPQSFQDMDRCESVSRFLFPYHIFW